HPLLLGLATPEAVLPLLPGPPPTRVQNGADRAHQTGLGLAVDPRLGPFPGRTEEDVPTAAAGALGHPGEDGVAGRARVGSPARAHDQPRGLDGGRHRLPSSARRVRTASTTASGENPSSASMLGPGK